MTEIINPYKKYKKKIKEEGSKGNKRRISEPSVPASITESVFKKNFKDSYNEESLPLDASLLSASDTSKIKIVLPSSQHIKLSVRLPKGIVTSLTIKKNIVALWILYTSDPEYVDIESINDLVKNSYQGSVEEKIEAEKELEEVQKKIMRLVNNFVYKCMESWDKQTGKGLSDYITERMIEDFLEDYILYSVVLTQIK